MCDPKSQSQPWPECSGTSTGCKPCEVSRPDFSIVMGAEGVAPRGSGRGEEGEDEGVEKGVKVWVAMAGETLVGG